MIYELAVHKCDRIQLMCKGILDSARETKNIIYLFTLFIYLLNTQTRFYFLNFSPVSKITFFSYSLLRVVFVGHIPLSHVTSMLPRCVFYRGGVDTPYCVTR